MSQNEISKSKQKRLEIEKNRKAQKRQKAMSSLVVVLVILAIAGIVALGIYLHKQSEVSFGKYLEEDGTIEGINAADYVTMDYTSLSYNRADLLPTEETISADIEALCDTYATLSTDTTAATKAGDTVNISYRATLDGVSYNEVTPESGGTDYEIGSGVISEEFDNAMIGRTIGEEFTVDVTLPADYSDAALAGATLTYEVTLGGIYIVPEFDDAFVALNLSEEAGSAEEYRQNLIDNYYESNLRNAVITSLENDSVITAYPEDYLENMKKIYYSQNLQQFNSYNSMYYEYLGYNMYSSPYEMLGLTSQEEYDAYVTSAATADVEYFLVTQYIFEAEGMTNTPEEVKAYYIANGYDDATYNDMLAQYGIEYMAQLAMSEKVVSFLMETATITE